MNPTPPPDDEQHARKPGRDHRDDGSFPLGLAIGIGVALVIWAALMLALLVVVW